MIHKIYLSIVVFLAAIGGFLYFLAGYRGAKIDRLQAEKNELQQNLKGCKNEMESYIKASERANCAIGEIRTIVKTVKSPCDCYNSSIEHNIIDRVRGK